MPFYLNIKLSVPFKKDYGGINIYLAPICKISHVYMQHIYVGMRLLYQHATYLCHHADIMYIVQHSVLICNINKSHVNIYAVMLYGYTCIINWHVNICSTGTCFIQWSPPPPLLTVPVVFSRNVDIYLSCMLKLKYATKRYC